MSKQNIQNVVKTSLHQYFDDLGDQKISNMYDMMVSTIEKPLLEVVIQKTAGNQSKAAELLGMNRNTLRKKLQQHGLS